MRLAQTAAGVWQVSAHYVSFEEISGIEGARWWFAAIVLFVLGALLLIPISLVTARLR